jgi:hypothetical protein
MSVPNIDTFEHDIADEIVHKEASIGDIAAASGDVGNSPSSKSGMFILSVSIIILCLVGAAVLGGYLYYAKKHAPAPLVPDAVTGLEPVATPGLPLSTISKNLDDGVGRFITQVEKSQYGYSMRVTSYSPVFAYMNTHEADFAEEIANAVGSLRDTSTSTPSFTFTDTTINNQNMRIGTSASSTVVYAFASPQILLIASSTESILALRSVILR